MFGTFLKSFSSAQLDAAPQFEAPAKQADLADALDLFRNKDAIRTLLWVAVVGFLITTGVGGSWQAAVGEVGERLRDPSVQAEISTWYLISGVAITAITLAFSFVKGFWLVIGKILFYWTGALIGVVFLLPDLQLVFAYIVTNHFLSGSFLLLCITTTIFDVLRFAQQDTLG